MWKIGNRLPVHVGDGADSMSLSCNLRGNALLGGGLRSLEASYLDVHAIMENIFALWSHRI